jgi:AraC-like DNA-binding protein
MTATPLFRLYLWSHRALYLGISPDNDLHRHHAAQLCLSLDATLQIRASTDAMWSEYKGVFIPPDQPHQIAAGDAMILALYLEPDSVEYRSLLQSVQEASNSEFQLLSLTDASLAQLRKLSEVGAEPTSVWSEYASALDLHTELTLRDNSDARVERIVEMIRNHANQAYTAEQLAQSVHLSPSRLRHLFRENVGVPIRRFVVWSRLRDVIRNALNGASLTESAHAAGFSDASHMSNTFRQMFGFAPSALFAQHISKDVYILE